MIVQLRYVYYLGRNRRVTNFLLIGGSLYALSVMLMYVFSESLSMQANQAYLSQTLITYTLQFVLNALITWRDREANSVENLKRVAKFIPSKFIVWTVNQCVFAFWSVLGVHYQVANALSVILIMGINYFLFDRLIFTE